VSIVPIVLTDNVCTVCTASAMNTLHAIHTVVHGSTP